MSSLLPIPWESAKSRDTTRDEFRLGSARALTEKILAIVDMPPLPSSEKTDTMTISQKHTWTVRQLDDRRQEIDELDARIVQSFFDWSAPEQEMRCPNMTPEEFAQLQLLWLAFSDVTWRLVERRMQISQEIWNIKKQHWLHNHIVDVVRKKKVIEQAKSYAPEDSHKRIEAFYEIIHDVSVRIQQEAFSDNR